MDEKLPELQEGLLGPEQVQALFADLATRVELLGLVTKGGKVEMASKDPVTLEQARDRLLAGEVHGVQVRYLHQGKEWCDTLLRQGKKVRLVRMELAAPPGQGVTTPPAPGQDGPAR